MRFVKKPVIIEAERFDRANVGRLSARFQDALTEVPHEYGTRYIVDTLEGKMEVNDGAWIIRGVNGEYYPCRADIFDKTYERVED